MFGHVTLFVVPFARLGLDQHYTLGAEDARALADALDSVDAAAAQIARFGALVAAALWLAAAAAALAARLAHTDVDVRVCVATCEGADADSAASGVNDAARVRWGRGASDGCLSYLRLEKRADEEEEPTASGWPVAYMALSNSEQ